MDDTATVIRNDKIYDLLTNFLANPLHPIKFNEPFSSEEVEILFNTHIWGHRELVLTILLTRLVYPDYKATEDLYLHHPRSVYEKPIRKALREYGIPHKKSGPLNVAKNIKRLNMDWATDKNDERVAISAVNIVEKLEKASLKEAENFASAYISRYLQEAAHVKDLEVYLPPQENPIYISKLCVDLINNVPDGGATAQYIIGLLMEAQKSSRNSDITISGHTDSVSATNTTSKKPGDVIELMNQTGDEIVYEVTTKAFNEDRLMESHEAVMAYRDDIADIFVICRATDVLDSLDVKGNAFLMASTQYKEISYYFVNIYEYIHMGLLFISKTARSEFYENLTGYINDINRSEKVKIYFKEWHEEEY